MQTISSQRHRDEIIVAEKLANEDFEVFVSPAFEIDGDMFRVVLDGHHSLEAAKQAGVEPEYNELTSSEHDAIRWLQKGDVQTFLEVTHMGDDYYDVETERDIW